MSLTFNDTSMEIRGDYTLDDTNMLVSADAGYEWDFTDTTREIRLVGDAIQFGRTVRVGSTWYDELIVRLPTATGYVDGPSLRVAGNETLFSALAQPRLFVYREEPNDLLQNVVRNAAASSVSQLGAAVIGASLGAALVTSLTGFQITSGLAVLSALVHNAGGYTAFAVMAASVPVSALEIVSPTIISALALTPVAFATLLGFISPITEIDLASFLYLCNVVDEANAAAGRSRPVRASLASVREIATGWRAALTIAGIADSARRTVDVTIRPGSVAGTAVLSLPQGHADFVKDRRLEMDAGNPVRLITPDVQAVLTERLTEEP